MLDFLYTFFIAPLEYWMQVALIGAHHLTKHWGEAIILMSLLVNFAILPIYMKAESWQEEERAIAKSFADKEAMIRRTFKGQERFAMLSTMQRQAHYSPMLKLRSSVGFILQVPFFFAAYHFLSHFEPLAGVSFLGLPDLAKPDALIHLGSISINVMPFVMTIVNLASALIYTKNLTKKDKNQLYAMAALFLVLLYDAASGLVLYWTINNVFSLVKNFCYSLCDTHQKELSRFFLLIKSLHKKYQCSMNRVASRVISSSFYLKALKTFKSYGNRRALSVLSLCILRFRNILKGEYKEWNYGVLIILAGLMPASVLWFSNLSFFSPVIVTTSFLTVACILLFIAVFLTLLKALSFNSVTQECFVLFMVIAACFIFYKNAWEIFLPLKVGSLAKASIVLIAFFLIILFGKIRTLNIILFISMTYAIVSGTYISYAENRATELAIRENRIEGISLKEKPNFYYILCESMQALDIAEKVYDFEGGSEFRNFLEEYSFLVPENVYSNADNTLATLYNIFTMSEKPSISSGNLDGPLALRDTIAGGEGNQLLKIFKKNGYLTAEYFRGSSYYFREKRKYLDVSDVIEDKKLDPLNYLYLSPVIFCKRLLDQFDFLSSNRLKKVETDYLKILQNHIKTYRGRPYFFLLHLEESGHSPSNGLYDYSQSSQWLASHRYRDGYIKEVGKLNELTSLILKNDSEAVIVLLGDHGAWRYRSTPKNKEEFHKILHATGASVKDYLDDRFKIFAAVRLPKKYGQIDENFSPANIFLKIFSQIGYDGLRLREGKNESYAGGMPFIKGPVLIEGVPVKDLY